MTGTHIFAVLRVAVFCLLWTPSFAACQLGKVADLPVTMAGRSAMVAAKINGEPVSFIADSGAFYSLITPASATRLKLRRSSAPVGMIAGIGGAADVSVTKVREFTLAGVAIPNVEFLVGGNEWGANAVGLMGQNVLRLADVEYDLANGMIRLVHPHGCEGQMLAYWSKPPQPFGVVDLEAASAASPHTNGTALINGVRMRVTFDTGAPTSMLTLAAAKRIGIEPHGAGIEAAGPMGGIGRHAVDTWIAPVASIKIGGEEIRNTRLRIGGASVEREDMLIGADFFLSHRVYVANSQHKLYFTYNGGPVFDVTSRVDPSKGGPEPKPLAANPTNAADFARRGAARLARQDFPGAIADFSEAIAQAPTDPSYVYCRGLAYLGADQRFQAMKDFDQALKLDPANIPALLARSRLRLATGQETYVLLDLATVDREASRDADSRLGLADLYIRAADFPKAVAQYDVWLTSHPAGIRRLVALNGRCWARALWGQEIDRALLDCNAALGMDVHNANVLDSRGLVFLRLGAFDKAISDYDASLASRPNTAWSLYGRGLAKLRMGKTSEGQADIAAAGAIQPGLPEEAKARGLSP